MQTLFGELVSSIRDRDPKCGSHRGSLDWCCGSKRASLFLPGAMDWCLGLFVERHYRHIKL